MATIQEAMSNSARLLDEAAKGEIEPLALTEQIGTLLSSGLGARGFMAALATGELPVDEKIRAALLDGIRAGKDNAYELIVKNIIMSGCAAQEHEQKGRREEARGSLAASACSLELGLLLDDGALRAQAHEALLAIDQWKTKSQDKGEKSGDNDTQEKWFSFFQRWGYSEKLLEAVKEPLLSLAEGS